MVKEYILDNQEIISLEFESNSISIVKSLGGTIYNLNLMGTDILFKDKDNELTKNDLYRGRFLFPFNDRIPNGTYSFNDKTYKFPLNCDNKDSIHGLIYNKKLEIVNKSESKESVSLTLGIDIKETDFNGYPFNIGLLITYTLNKSGLRLDFNINNNGNNLTPYAFGWHPYFTFGKKIDSAKLKFNGLEYYDVDENLYYKGNHYSVKDTDYDFSNGKQISELELDIAVSLKDQGVFTLTDYNRQIKVDFNKEMFPNLQLFIPEDRESIAIEPITAPSDSFNYPEAGLKILKPKEAHTGYIEVSLS